MPESNFARYFKINLANTLAGFLRNSNIAFEPEEYFLVVEAERGYSNLIGRADILIYGVFYDSLVGDGPPISTNELIAVELEIANNYRQILNNVEMYLDYASGRHGKVALLQYFFPPLPFDADKAVKDIRRLVRGERNLLYLPLIRRGIFDMRESFREVAVFFTSEDALANLFRALDFCFPESLAALNK